MDRIIFKGNKIVEYIEITKNYVNEFINTIKVMDLEKNKLVWESSNYNQMMFDYDNMIKDYLAYTNRMIKLIDYLNRLVGRYDETFEIIKKEYHGLDNEYNIEVKDE